MTIIQKATTPFLVLPLVALAQSPIEVDWGTGIAGPVSVLTTSTGGAITPADFDIQIGTFDAGFTPDSGNIDMWLANWNIFDAITVGDADPNDTFSSSGGLGGFQGTAFLQADGTSDSEDTISGDVFPADSQAYIFIRDSDVPEGDSEWLLVTSETGNVWEFPEAGAGQENQVVTFSLLDADTAIFGGVNDTVGEGLFDPNAPDEFVLRTHTFVPEPSVSLLVVASCLSLLGRRRRIK